MKVAIVGGGGLVGSCTAFALQMGGVAREIALIDANAALAEGQALDLLHGSALTADQRIVAGGYEHAADADVICITAGLRRKPDESRLDLINRNVDLFLSILEQVQRVGHRSDVVVHVVSNPVDVLTFLAAKTLRLPVGQVIGLGTQLDTARFRSLIAAATGLAATQVAALVLGEHGDSMVPIWSSATAGGLALEKHPGWSTRQAEELFQRTKGSGAEVIGKKGGAGFAVGLAIREVIESIALDRRRTLPVSTVQEGCYGLRDVALSVPTVVGRAGAIARHEIELWPKGRQGGKRSGQGLRETITAVEGRLSARG